MNAITTHIRNYQSTDKNQCLAVFQSNCPQYFDVAEYAMFEKWLDHQGNIDVEYSSPTYNDSKLDVYLVLCNDQNEILGCGGYYVLKDESEARLAWGMIHHNFHGEGHGRQLFDYRERDILKRFPDIKVTLGTSQHTFQFYEKMGMKVVEVIPKGYGPDLDQVNMEKY